MVTEGEGEGGMDWEMGTGTQTAGDADGRNPPASAGDPGSIPGSGGSPGEGHGNPLQCSCLDNPMDGGACWATVHGITRGQTGLWDLTSLSYSSLQC